MVGDVEAVVDVELDEDRVPPHDHHVPADGVQLLAQVFVHLDLQADGGGQSLVDLGDLYAGSGQTLQGSFSAVSKPNFARKYALESSRRDLHNALLCTILESFSTLNFCFKKTLKNLPNFTKFARINFR